MGLHKEWTGESHVAGVPRVWSPSSIIFVFVA